MGSLLGAFILLLTVVLAVGLGIFTAYGAVIGILNLFGQSSAPAIAVLVPSETPASGD